MRTASLALLATLTGACSSSAPSIQGATVPADGPCVSGAGITTITPNYAYELAFDDASLYAATSAGVVRFPLGGGTGTTLTSSAEVYALAVAKGSAYFISSHAAGPPDPQGKVSSTTALYRMTLPGGTPEIFVDGAWGTQLASDGTWVWLGSVGALKGTRIADGMQVTVPLAASASVQDFAMGSDALYLALQHLRPDYTNYGSIARVSSDGSVVSTIVDNLPDFPFKIAIGASAVYWIDDKGIWRAGLDGSNVTQIVKFAVTSLAVDAHSVYFTTGASSTATSAVQKVPTGGGAPETVANGLKAPGTIALHGGNVYWVNGTSVAASDPNPGYAVMTACK
jgi:hypothetical protein